MERKRNIIITLFLLILLGIAAFLVHKEIKGCVESIEGPDFKELTTMINSRATVDIDLNAHDGWFCPDRDSYTLQIV